MRDRRASTAAGAGAAAAVALLLAASLTPRRVPADPPRRLDPAAWGGDHVGGPVPDYTTGDECLFCHRDSVGKTWADNRHQTTIRPADEGDPALDALRAAVPKDLADGVALLLGHDRRRRFLRRGEAYGTLDLLNVAWTPPRDGAAGTLEHADGPRWDSKRFGDACAGCHATAVDPKDRAFSALSIDCYACHGLVPPEHTERPALAHLAPSGKEEARVLTSICAQCHARSGRSASTGRPYPNNFVAGDNLFRDFRVDLSEEALRGLSTADRHVLENVRDVAVEGEEAVTCLTCHDVHGRSSRKHRRLPEGRRCATCHEADGPKLDLKPFTARGGPCFD